jgi:hypothetical protein
MLRKRGRQFVRLGRRHHLGVSGEVLAGEVLKIAAVGVRQYTDGL